MGRSRLAVPAFANGITARIHQTAPCRDEHSQAVGGKRSAFRNKFRLDARNSEYRGRGLRQPVAGPRRSGVRRAPCVEIPVDGDDLLLLGVAAQRKRWRNIAHPNVIDRRFDDTDIGAGCKFPLRLTPRMPTRREQANGLISRNGVHHLAEFAFDFVGGFTPLAVNGPSHPAAGVGRPFRRNTNRHQEPIGDNDLASADS